MAASKDLTATKPTRFRVPAGIINLVGLVVAWIAIFLYFRYQAPLFGTRDNLETLARQGAMVCVASLGMTFIIISGGIDLSVGSIMALVTVVVAWVLHRGFGPWHALLAGLAAGAFCGLVNGLVITRLKVVPFIVTLGTYLIVRGAAKGLAHNKKIDAPITWLNDLLAMLSAKDQWKLLPMGVWLTLALAVFVAWMLRFTRFGRHVVAVGSNEQAARLCGVPVEWTKLMVYVLGGFFAGVAGLLLFSRLSVGDPTVAVGMELDVIAAVVIGGASLSGGEGSIAGSLLGAFIMVTLRSGGSQLGWDDWRQDIITGAIIVLAVALDRMRVRKSV
jgi:ribose transport system permease protein